MEETSKYYTPESEEFHIGFECEWSEYGRKIWIKEIIDEDDLSDLCLGTERTSHYRVKHLDQQDIEGCGFSICGIGQCGSENGQYDAVFFGKPIIYRNSKSTASMIWNPINGWVCISVNNNGRDNTLFAGTIKNKSELKRIMKMIGI